MASIKDVARTAGVAPSTVSLVLNKKGYVSEATRKKVESAMQRLHYVPSEVARNLSLNRTNTIGVIVPSIAHPFFAELIEALESELYRLGYKMMLCSTQAKENSERTFIDMLRRKTMDGIIMGAHSLDVSIYDDITRPIVAFDRYLNDTIPIVHCDHIMGGRLAAEAFLAHDCQHIVQITGSQTVKTPANEYHKVFQQVIEAQGIKIDLMEMPWNAFSPNDFMVAVNQLFATYPDVDGIFGADMVIACCLNVATAKGISIPDDLKLVAYDGTSLTRMGARLVTSVRQPIAKLAELAAVKVVNMVNGMQDEIPWIIEPELIKGETC